MKIWHSAADTLAHDPLLLGEGPRWDAATGTLSLVGIDDRLFGTVGDDDAVSFTPVPDFLGSAVPWRDGLWLAAYGTTLAGLTRAGDLFPFAELPLDAVRLRANDGACDPAGRFWVGVMDRGAAAGAGSLWVVRPDGSTAQVLDGMTIPNGLGWSPDGTVMYVTDTHTGTITGYAFDPDSGTLGQVRTVIRTDPRLGGPDGLAVDAQGSVWTAVWDGGVVLRHAPDGGLTGVVEVPVPRPTSCAFAGHDLRDLVVTTASVALDDQQLARHPMSGRTLRMRVDAEGLPSTRFAAPAPAALPQGVAR
jgi:sugar lactone lactonase YvrE